MATNTEDDTVTTATAQEGVLAVMAALGTLPKEQQNKFDNYEYASIDDFIHFVRGHCSAALISIEQDEVEAKLVDVAKKDGKTMAMWWAKFAFTIRHKSGDTIGPIHRSVMVQANGAQASGSAQSYAMKQFMRSQFLIPTGDADDPDKEKTEISAQRGANETDLQRKAGAIRRKILTAQTLDDLALVWSDNAVDIDHIKRVSDTAHEFLTKEYNVRELALKQKEGE